LAEFAPLEIHALARIMDELDYYQLLHLSSDASAREIKQAYHAHSRTFHPDANKHLEPELQADCAAISKRVTEAYCVLKDVRKRQAYDRRLQEGGTRLQLAEARAQVKQETHDRDATTPQGKQFHQKAVADLRSGDLDGAIRNLQTALTFEPGNDGLKAMLEETRQERERARKAARSAP